MQFAYPAVLLAGLLVLPLAFFATRRAPPAVSLPSLAGVMGVAPTLRLRLLWVPVALRALAIVALLVAVARPRTVEAETVLPAEGIDIVLALDISGSMELGFGAGGASRLDTAIEVIQDFIASREDDRIGLVVFSQFALTMSPPTLDHAALSGLVADSAGFELKNATGIGLAVAEATSVLQDSHAPSRIVILLTDGVDNVEEAISPLTAARAASALGVRVYTIGIVSQNAPGGIDRDTLNGIAEITGARPFEADSPEDLESVYQEIDRLEKSSAERDRFTSYREFGPWFALLAAGLVATDVLLRATWLRRASA